VTPTYYGFLQTRFLLFTVIGLPITFGFANLYRDYMTPFAILGYLLIFGFAWDAAYKFLVTLRWDHDWPPAYQLFAGIWEGFFFWILLQTFRQSGQQLPGISELLTFSQFLLHYSTVWIFIFIGTQGPLRILFPRWRFRGGKWL